MLVWLFVLLLLIILIYGVYKLIYSSKKRGLKKDERHYTFKL